MLTTMLLNDVPLTLFPIISNLVNLKILSQFRGGLSFGASILTQI